MIFPILSGFMGFKKAPVVWILVLLNFIVLLFTTLDGGESQSSLDALMRNSYFVSTQGRLYAHYLEGQPVGRYSPFLLSLGNKVEHGAIEQAEILGQLAFRDFNFLNDAPSMGYDGDQVAFEFWKKRSDELQAVQSRHPSFVLGLNSDDMGLRRWITYIFVHSGWMHFLGNMIFLLIFGAALELQIGGLGVLVVFLLSGAMAAGAFVLVTGVTSSPLVGASGAISGIMALYCILNWSKPARYFYWLFLPFRGYMGFIYFPAWIALALWVAGDLAGYLGTLPELGGVAHTAHLGGEAAGLMTGVILFAIRRRLWSAWSSRDEAPSSSRVNSEPSGAIPGPNASAAPMGKMFPFLAPLPPRQGPTNYSRPD